MARFTSTRQRMATDGPICQFTPPDPLNVDNRSTDTLRAVAPRVPSS